MASTEDDQPTELIVIRHGANADVPRPPAGVVRWIGSVEPTHATVDDEFTDTVNKVAKLHNGVGFDTLGTAASGASMPIASPAGSTIDTTTYNDPFGTGPMAVAVFPAEATVLAIAKEGDTHPRWILTADSGDGLYLGDGTADPTSVGGAIFYSGGALNVVGPQLVIRGYSGGIVTDSLPTADPHVAGQLWNSAGAVHVSAG